MSVEARGPKTSRLRTARAAVRYANAEFRRWARSVASALARRSKFKPSATRATACGGASSTSEVWPVHQTDRRLSVMRRARRIRSLHSYKDSRPIVRVTKAASGRRLLGSPEGGDEQTGREEAVTRTQSRVNPRARIWCISSDQIRDGAAGIARAVDGRSLGRTDQECSRGRK